MSDPTEFIALFWDWKADLPAEALESAINAQLDRGADGGHHNGAVGTRSVLSVTVQNTNGTSILVDRL